MATPDLPGRAAFRSRHALLRRLDWQRAVHEQFARWKSTVHGRHTPVGADPQILPQAGGTPPMRRGRGHIVAITEAGRDLRRRIWPVYAGAINDAVGARRSQADTVTLADLLRRLPGRMAIESVRRSDGAPSR
jgi:hypothetical protein